jgi:uncharacterized protein (DUF433 family)
LGGLLSAFGSLDGHRRLGYCSGMDYRTRITVEPGKRSGKPCIRGLRITVQDVLEYLASGMSQDEILADFPYLEPEDILACLAYAADLERKTIVVPATV